MRSFVALLALLLAGCASMFESPREAIVEVLEELPQSEGEKYSGYTYIPLDPLAVVFQGCQNDGVGYAPILDQLPDNAVRIATKKLSGGTESSFGPVGIGIEGEEYKIILDYVNVDNTNILFDIEIVDKEIWDSEASTFKKIRSYSVQRLREDRDSVYDDRSSGEQRRDDDRLAPGGDDIRADEGEYNVVLRGKFVVPVYVGVGLRLTSEVRILRGSVNLSSLPGIAASVSAGNAAGSLVVQTLGVTGKQVSTSLTFTSDLNETTVQNAILSLGKIKAILYSEDSIVRPRVTGMYLPFRDGSDDLVNLIVSELARRPIVWSHELC